MTIRAEWRRWAAPAFGIATGLVLAGIYLARDDVGSAVASLAVMGAYAAVLVLGRRNEFVGLLGSGEVDERRAEINRRSSMVGGYVLLTAVLGGFVWEMLEGRDGQPYAALGALSGVAFIAATAYYRRRL